MSDDVRRFVDRPYYNFSTFAAGSGGIAVRCPKCGGMGLVTLEDDTLWFRCAVCGKRQCKSKYDRQFDVHAQCAECGRYFRVDITDKNRQHFTRLHVACPYCGAFTPGTVHRTENSWWTYGEIKDGNEPYFGYPLYYQSSFDGKPVWAVNREHLQYLADYLEAALREKPAGAKMTQADHLPAFMKLAKNRNGIVKVLRKMLAEE
jgi:DNA-directed RNA polymerase subunit RPC12/RpoP